MGALKLYVLSACGIAAALALGAAQRPQGLGMAAPGLWEVSGVPGSKAAIRECVADVGALARFEHRAANCTQTVVSDSQSSTVIQYSCPGGGFGRSKVDVLTPRSLRISTQGISQDLPFGYVLQARRVGDCPKSASASRH